MATKQNTQGKPGAAADSADGNPGAEMAEDRHDEANRVIRRNMGWSIGAGLIPMAFVDTAALVAVQVKLLRDLSKVYEVPFRRDWGKTAVTALIGAALPSFLGHGSARLLAANSPYIGNWVALITVPAFATAMTYATGKVFQQHFASGGTFLDFDPRTVEAYFREKFHEAAAAQAAGGQSGSKAAGGASAATAG